MRVIRRPMQTVKITASPAFLVCLILCASVGASGQTPSPAPTPAATPSSSDIFIIDVTKHNGQMKFSEPKKITDTVGYNNQPFFLPDGQGILYTSIRDKQADIYHYDIHSGATAQVTKTPESEYSPTLMPDGKSISVVRVEADGTQRLWKFPPILGKPNTLQIADTRTEKVEIIAENPGRILRRIPHQNKFSFVHKISDKEWAIKAFDLRMRTSASLIDTLPGVEDYAWLPSGLLLMARDSKLFSVIPLTGKAWSEVADFSNAGLKNITRIAVSPKGDKIAVVARH